ncbi:MAG: arginine--tRNA ligase [Nitrospirae bacterium]|nr:arginine--tRNA ligase [Nitrospirota bacterium]
MKKAVTEAITNAIASLKEGWGLESIPYIDVEIPRNEDLGDAASTVAMGLTKTLKKPPKKIAEELLSEIVKQSGPFENIEIAGAGFINFRFKKEYLYENLQRLLSEGHPSLSAGLGQNKRIQVEFISANPTGPLHIGHGRGAAIGNALSNLLTAAGFEVEKEFYVNDAGLQVKLLGLSVYSRYQQALGNDVHFPENGYKGDYIASIAEEIIKDIGNKYLNNTFEQCGDFFISHAYKMMLSDIERDLKDFGVTFDKWQSEKELYEKGKVQGALTALQHKNFLYEKDGAKWFSSTNFGDDKDRVVVKQDGEYTYFASDIAYHKDKLDRGFDTIIDIWGADHHGYIPRIRSVLSAFGLSKEKFRVIIVQMVTLLRHGKPVQMSKRAGEFITLREVIDEVGSDTAKFIFLTRRADSQLEFDIEVAKEQSAENPVFYVQYAFARISSIFRQAEERRVRGQKDSSQYSVDSSQGTANSSHITYHALRSFRVQGTDLTALKEVEEIAIIKKLLQYPMMFEGAVFAFEPHRITYYLQDLARLFHSYYNKHRVLTDDSVITGARLSLCRAVQLALEEGLKILGVSAPEKM